MKTASHIIPRDQLATLGPVTELTAASLDVAETPGAPESYTLSWFVNDDEITLFENILANYIQVKLEWKPVPEGVDYVAATRANFPPLQVGPFIIVRNNETLEEAKALLSHSEGNHALRSPAGEVGLISIPPNMAFGSGEHATTSGCLTALSNIEHSNIRTSTSTYLDVGAGSAILAIAAAKLHHVNVICTDNDPASVGIGQQNAADNNVAESITYVEDATLTHPDVQKNAPYPLIFANILLEPLLLLAPRLAALLAPGGTLILSGFTVGQGPKIHTAYTQLGLKHTAELSQAGWLTHTYGK